MNKIILETNSWQTIINAAKSEGYTGPDNLMDNRSKAWSAEYLKNKGYEIKLVSKKLSPEQAS